jgi:hypothetical protein
VEQRILLCGLMVGAFILTLTLSSWHDGLWRSDAAPVTRAAPNPHEDGLVPRGAVAAPAAAAMNPPRAIAPPEPAQSEPQSEPSSAPDVDDGERLARRDRGAERGSRSR